MTLQWYYARDGRTLGPVSGEQLQQLSRQGELSANDLIWRDGMAEWAPASTVGLGSSVSAPPPLPNQQFPPSPTLPSIAERPLSVQSTRPRGATSGSRTLMVVCTIAFVLAGIGAYWIFRGAGPLSAPRNVAKIEPRPKAKDSVAQSPDRPPSKPRPTASESPEAPVHSFTAQPKAPAADEAPSPTTTPADPLPARSLELPQDNAAPEKNANPSAPDKPEEPPKSPDPSTVVPAPATQPKPATASVTQSSPPKAQPESKRRPLYQQVEILRRPRFSIQGLETAQEIHYQLISRLDIGPPADGRRNVVQYVHETRLLAADELSRAAFAQSLERLKGHQYTYTLNDRGEVLSFTGHKDNLKSLPVDLASATGIAVTSVIDKDGWKELAELTFLIPDPQAATNKTWIKPMAHDWGALGSWYGTTTLKLGLVTKGIQDIHYTHEMAYRKPMAQSTPLPFTIKDARFEPQKAGGRLQFDTKRQQVRWAQEEFAVQGVVTAELLGQPVEIQMTEQQLIEIRIFDQLPTQQK